MANIVTPEFRASYVWIFNPQVQEDGSKKYSVSMIFPKNADLKALKEAAKQAGLAKFGDKFNALSKSASFKWPFRDGDTDRPEDEAYAGSIFVNASSRKPVGVVDKSNQEILDAEDFYSGCYAKASVSFYGYDVSGSKGIACGISAIKKTRDGDALGGSRVDATKVNWGEDDSSNDNLIDDLLM
jgi:hypothetical protein